MRTPERSPPLIARLPFLSCRQPNMYHGRHKAGHDQVSISKSVNRRASVEDRLDLDDRRTVVAANPERARIGPIVDVDAADIGRAWQLGIDVLPSLHVET